jgi:hypothetical protein
MVRAFSAVLLLALLTLWTPAGADEPVPAPAPPPAPAPAAPGEPPPAPPGPRPAPILVPDKPEHDFGIVAQNQKLDAQFTLKNIGTVPVRINKPIADCGCYAATVEANEVAPGGEVKVSIKFDTGVWSGPLAKKLRIQSSDPGRPDLTLPLKMDIVAGVVLDPGRIVFGDVELGESPSRSFQVKWFEGVGKPFKVTGVELPGAEAEFEVTQEPYAYERWKGVKVTVSFRKAPPLGQFSRTLLVRTDAPGYERLDMPLQAYVSGKVWVQERQVNMGWVRQGETKTRPLRVKPLRKGTDLGKVSARSRNGVLQVEAVPDGADRKGWWIVNIVVPATAAKGPLLDVIEVLTEVKGEEVTVIEVKAEILG